jgi:predicted secreted protein
MFKIILTSLLLLVSLTSVAKKHLLASDYSKPIIVTESAPAFTITLPSNRSTGYSWFLLSYNDDYIIPMTEKYLKPQKNVPGAPTVSRWSFNIDDDAFKVPHIFYITMLYARPWNLRASKRKIITVITTKDKKNGIHF